MGDYLYMSFIIRTFVLSMVNTDDGFGGMSFAEGRLPRAYNIYKHKKIPHHK
jgi:hypothetical protein